MTRSLRRLDRPQLRTHLAAFLDASYRQTWCYAEGAACRLGAESAWYAIDQDGILDSIANVRVKRLPLGLGGIAFVSGGPLVCRRGESDPAAERTRFVAAVRCLREEFCARRGMTLRIHPAVGATEWNAAQDEALRELGFFPSHDVARYRTFIKSIEGSEDELRRSLAQKWRNQLNSAGRQGLDVVQGEGLELFDRFQPLFEETKSQKGFAVELDLAYFRKVREASLPGEPHPVLTLITKEGRDVSGHLGMYVGDIAVYLLGGTNDEGRKLKAAYLAQWEAIRHARACGCRWYDTGGIDPEGNPGVYHFKEGLAGIDVTAAGPCDHPGAGMRGLLTTTAERVYRRLRARRASKQAPATEHRVTGDPSNSSTTPNTPAT